MPYIRKKAFFGMYALQDQNFAWQILNCFLFACFNFLYFNLAMQYQLQVVNQSTAKGLCRGVECFQQQ